MNSLGVVPILYGRNNARFLLSQVELITCIMSPGKDLKDMQTPRTPLTPTSKAFFTGMSQQVF